LKPDNLSALGVHADRAAANHVSFNVIVRLGGPSLRSKGVATNAMRGEKRTHLAGNVTFLVREVALSAQRCLNRAQALAGHVDQPKELHVSELVERPFGDARGAPKQRVECFAYRG
jgi:hypothetical protein